MHSGNSVSQRDRSAPSPSSWPAAAQVPVKSELTSSPDSRLLRLPTPTVPPAHSTSPSLASQGAISSQHNTTSLSHRQDVLSVKSPAQAPRQFGQPLETPVSSSPQQPPTHHVITNPSTRLRTTNPTKVFASTSDLAAHYGIPQILPPPPTRTHRQQHPVPAPQRPTQNNNNNSLHFDFNSLKNQYLNMLATPATDNTPSSTTSMVAPPTTTNAAPAAAAAPADASGDMEQLFNYLASPEFKDLSSFSAGTGDFDMAQYLTSPLAPELADDFDSPEDTPFHHFLTTPLIQDGDDAAHDFGNILDFEHEPLFADLDAPVVPAHKQLEPAMFSGAGPVMDLDFEGLHTISPHTPMLDTPAMDPVSLYPAPRHPSTAAVAQHTTAAAPTPAPAPAPSRRRSTATGTRKGITPDSLVPLDAPTQPRKYVTPSATSRKELPAVFARKRARSEALGNDDDDELDNEKAPGPNATEKEQIEWKRRQNTLAARKSRKRKLQHQQELEDSVRRLEGEKEVWRTRALTFRELLVSHGIPFNEFQD